MEPGIYICRQGDEEDVREIKATQHLCTILKAVTPAAILKWQKPQPSADFF